MPNTNIAPTMKLGLKDRLIGIVGRIFSFRPTGTWRAFLRNNATLSNLAQAFPRLTMKIYRPYMTKGVSCAGRVDALITHYRLVQERGFMEMARRVANQPITLAEFVGKNGTAYRLELYGMLLGSCEGEFSLRLASDETQLYRASFLFGQENHASFLKLTCLQGVRADSGALFVKEMTRDFHACRPKNLMVAALRDIGGYFACEKTILVGNQNRILARRLFRPNPEVSADYDGTWSDMGAVKRADGDFEMPCSEILKTNFDDVQSKKRSEAKKRNALLEAIFVSVRLSLDQERLPKGPNVASAASLAIAGAQEDETLGMSAPQKVKRILQSVQSEQSGNAPALES